MFSRFLLSAFAGIVSCTLACSQVFAANLVVNSTDDEFNSDGDCSLREAIVSANEDFAHDGCVAGDGADVLTVPAGFYQLTDIECEFEEFFGFFDSGRCGNLDITDDLQIVGDSDGGTIIDGGKHHHQYGGVFWIHSVNDFNQAAVTSEEAEIVQQIECASGLSVTISDITVQNGLASVGGGIALYSFQQLLDSFTLRYDQLTLNRVTVRNNRAIGIEGGAGGGVFSDGLLVANNSVITGNAAPRGLGGGLLSVNARYHTGSESCKFASTLLDTQVDDNHLIDGESEEQEIAPTETGGGIYNASGKLVVQGSSADSCSISRNEVYNSGGGVFNGDIIVIEGCNILNNIADYVLFDPEAVASDGYGAGIYGQEFEVCGYFDTGNNLGEEACSKVNSLTVTDSMISGNHAGYEGGGIFAFAPVTIRRTAITGNDADWYSGGASFYGNHQFNPETESITHRGEVILEKSTVSGNNSDAWAGGIYNNAEFRCENSTISGNTATQGWGGGFIQDSDSDATPALFRNCTITKNEVDRLPYDQWEEWLKESYDSCYEARDYLHGAGLYVYTGKVTLSNSIVAGNIDGDACTVEPPVQDEIEPIVNLDLDLETGLTAPDCWVYPTCVNGIPVDSDEDDGGGPFHCEEIISLGHNLIGTNQNCAIPSGRALGDQVGTILAPIDPRIGPLADNGGPTQTHALLDGSAALDAGSASDIGSDDDASCIADDQRFEQRPEIGKFGGSARCDIGSYERLAQFDCANTPWGLAALDRCGVCAGDGNSCLECTDINILETQFQMDGGGKALENIARRVARRLKAVGRKKQARALRKRAKEVQARTWTLSWSMPTLLTQCANKEFCVDIANTSEVDQYVAASTELVQLIEGGVQKIRKATKNKRHGRRFLNAAENQHQQNIAAASKVPTETSVCS